MPDPTPPADVPLPVARRVRLSRWRLAAAGVPAVTTAHVSAEKAREWFASHYGVPADTCEPADPPAEKG